MARRPAARTQVLGPYPESGRGQWKYAVVVDGRRTWRRCSKGCTEEEARAEVEGARRELNVPDPTTVEKAIDAFVGYQTTAASEVTASADRAALLPLRRVAGNLLVTRLTPAHIERFLVLLAEPVASANCPSSRSWPRSPWGWSTAACYSTSTTRRTTSPRWT